MATIGVMAADKQQPRLLLNIMVDGLDAEYLDILRDQFGPDGFRRLCEKGIYFQNVDYGPGIDATAATAMIMTGAAPSLNGIAAETYYDRSALRPVEIFADASSLGNFTSSTFSPKALKLSTISDEARIASGGVNVAYAVAPTSSVALALAGHSANSALWLDDKSGNWASSTHYKEMPVAVATRNRTAPLSSRMDTMSWTPSLAPDQYPALPDHLKRYPFRHVFPHANSARLDMFEQSPLINRETTSVAIDLLSTLKIGQHEGVTDVLSLAYNLQPYTYGKNPDNRAEVLDSYIKLDTYLQQLFSDIDRRIGAGNTVIMLAATPPTGRSRRDDEQFAIPTGEFSTRKAISLLNMYLIALYGNGDYVTAYHNGHFFLNHNLLKEKSLNEDEVRSGAASFLARMTGVDRVFTIDEVLRGHAGEQPEAMRRNTSAATAGDLIISIAPGFEIVDDYNNLPAANHTPMVQRAVATTAPAFIFAPGLGPNVIETPVDARSIAPTVAKVLRIRSPNGSALPSLPLNNINSEK